MNVCDEQKPSEPVMVMSHKQEKNKTFIILSHCDVVVICYYRINLLMLR